jgi:hypothetical protein
VICQGGPGAAGSTQANTSSLGCPSLFVALQLAALEQFCSRNGMDPSKYRLMHGKAAVDMSLPLRLANVPANAVLELVPTGAWRRQPARGGRRERERIY